jgi:hypothetical protein
VFSARQVIDLDRPLWLAGSVARLTVPRVEPTRPEPITTLVVAGRRRDLCGDDINPKRR